MVTGSVLRPRRTSTEAFDTRGRASRLLGAPRARRTLEPLQQTEDHVMSIDTNTDRAFTHLGADTARLVFEFVPVVAEPLATV